jgi:glycosyltransferase involved in cell wall biosynthesis
LSQKITVTIITFNEEQNISECLRCVDWADEIIVVDSFSTDKTVEIAKKFTDKVIQVEWKGYSAAKNYALQLAQNNWVLSLDADERVTPELAKEIHSILESAGDSFDGYEVARRAYFLGKWIRHCGWYPGYTLRLFKKSAGSFSNSLVHERLNFKGKTGKLKNDLLHYTDRNIFQYFEKFNRYTALAVDDMAGKGKKFKVIDLIFRPLFTFLKMYFLRGGWLEGIHGLILSVFSAAYVFIKYAKLWEFKKNKSNH